MAFSAYVLPPVIEDNIRPGYAVAREWNVYLGFDCDVVVSLVRRRPMSIAPNASTYQGYPAEYMSSAMERAMLNLGREYEVSLGDVHMNSSRLRSCSKYFDACLSERWARRGSELNISSTTPIHLTLDIHTDVQYYKDCFSQMNSYQNMWIPNVNHCLKLLQVASQISYLELVEYCVHYLTSVPWSPIDEQAIRQLANSVFYPSDCAANLSARLGLTLTNTDKYGLLLGITERALCRSFDDFLSLDVFHNECCQEFFSSGFRLIMAGPCHTRVENVLRHVYDCIKKLILEAKAHPASKEFELFYNVNWILVLLLETRCATRLVEYIVDESPLCEMLKTTPALRPIDWVFLIFTLFRNVVEGRLMLRLRHGTS